MDDKVYENASKYARSLEERLPATEAFDFPGAYLRGYTEAEQDLGWHSVEESLPEMDEEVIVLKDNLGTAPIYEIAMGHIVDRNHCSDYNGWNIPGVKFWMPMPKIPEEQK